jgi:two-component system response regulator YesN
VADTLVLIADDAPAAKRSLRHIIAGLPGFRLVGEAADGREALSLALALHPHVLITDIRMPCLDGLGLTAELRKRGCDMEVVIVTGYADFEYARSAMRHRVAEYLLKPIVPEQVARILNRIRAAREREGPQDPSLSLPMRTGLDYIAANYTRPDLSLTEVAAASGCSPTHFCRLFKKAVSMGYAAYLRHLRLKLAVQLLSRPHNRVFEVARYCGYSSYSTFERVFREAFGQTPTRYRDAGSRGRRPA